MRRFAKTRRCPNETRGHPRCGASDRRAAPSNGGQAMTYALMIILETIDEPSTVHVLRSLFEAEPELSAQQGYARSENLIEAHARMLVWLTVWRSREDAIQFHSSRLNRRLLARIDSCLIGEPVVKLLAVAKTGVH